MIGFIFNLIITALVVVFHGKIEHLFFDAGASWTLAKLIPYIVVLSSATTTLLLSIRTFKSKKIIGILIGAFIFSTAIGVDFYFHKIYQGDFSNDSVSVQSSNVQIEPNSITVIAIPGCPFCHGSIEMLKVMKQRNPSLKINFLVCSSDSTSLEQYQKPIDQKFNLALLYDLEELSRLKINSFPTFIFTDRQGNKSLWLNDTFGNPAKDYVEKMLNN